MRTMKRTFGALLLSAGLVLGMGAVAQASPQSDLRSDACKAGMAQLREVRGQFDKRYDRIIGSGIIGTACATEGYPIGMSSQQRGACAIATDMFAEFSPLFKTTHDRGLADSIVAATCS
jgi:hypothetical protein